MSESEFSPLEASSTVEKMSLKARAMRMLPWFVTIIALSYIFATTDFAEIRSALGRANWVMFLGSMLVLYTGLWFIDSTAVHYVYRRFHDPQIRYKDVIPARGATYLIGILNYAAGTASMALYFKKRFNIGVLEGGASLLLLMLVDLGLIVSVAVVGAILFPGLPEEYRQALLLVGGAVAAGAIAHLVFWRATWSWGPLEALRDWPKLRGFRVATVLDYLKLGAMRFPVVAIYVMMHAATLHAFGIFIPLRELLVYVPIQMVVAALPISVSGLGTTNAVQRVLYIPFAIAVLAPTMEGASDAALDSAATGMIDAYAIALYFSFVLPRVLIGLASLRATARALSQSAEDPFESEQEPDSGVSSHPG